MASNSIKIFNDTVLKQSVLQGYEVQRTNNNLGQFTMGELAFTRDTGRLFVGNVTNSLKDKDSLPVTGGILTGNKYLGAIDSKPLIHFAASGETGWKPLSYEEDVKDATMTEYALFGEKSRFRKTDGVGGNGWDKNAQFIEKYGVYSGDYTFDVYNNALIIFDKSITTRPSEQPRRELITDKNGKKIEVIKGFDGSTLLDIQLHKRRTPLFNSAMEANSEYPIYGDGYVVMRILEPDGVTLGYSDRTFKNDTTDLTDAEPKTIDNNWSHNYLTIKNVPSSTLQASFSTQFVSNVTEGLIYLNNNLTGIDSISPTSGNTFTLPSIFKFSNKLENSPTFKYNLDNKIINVSNPDDYIFTLSSDGAGSNAYSMKISKQSNPSFTIKLKDGLINPLTGRSELTLNTNNSKAGMLALGFVTSEISTASLIGNNNPFGSDTPSNYYYVGTAIFDSSGSLKGTEKYDENYKNTNSSLISKFESSDNCGLNLLKEPLTICWSTPIESDIDTTSSTNCHFLISPYVCCIKKEYTSSVESEKTSPFDGTVSSEIDETKWENYMSVIGNNTLASSNLESIIGVVAGYSFDISDTTMKSLYLSQNNKTKKSCRIPLDFNVDGEKTAYDMYATYKNVDGEIVYYLSLEDNKYFKLNSNNVLVEETQPNLENLNYGNNLYVMHTSSNLDSIKFDKPYIIEKDCFANELVLIEMGDGTTNTIEGAWAPKLKYENYTVLMTLKKEENNFYAYDGPEDLISLSSHFETEDVIKSIEISTNDLSKEWITLFAAPKASDITDSGCDYVYYPDEKTRVVVIKDEGSIVTYQCVLNAPLFIENNYSPYYLRVNYRTTNDDGDAINTSKFIKLDSVITYDVESSSSDYKCFVNNGTQSSSSSFDILTDGKFDTAKITSNKIDAICEYELEDALLLVTSNDIVKNTSISNSFATVLQTFYLDTELVTLTYNVTFRLSSVKTPMNNEEYSKNFMIKKVVCEKEERNLDGDVVSTTVLTLLWDSDDLTQKDKIVDLINDGVVEIPETFTIPYKDATYSYVSFKNVPSLPNGYNIPTDVQKKVVIPTHASSILLEVHRVAPSSNTNPVTIYTAQNLSSLKPTTSKSTTNEETGVTTTLTVNDNNFYEFPFKITSSSQLPTVVSGKGINEKMKVLYTSTSTGCQVIEVPLYKSVINNYKGFILRMANVNCGNTDGKFLIRLIGYRV